MFQIFMIIGWTVMLVILLYVWADVRELAGVVKDNRRELIRGSFGGRAAETFPDLRETAGDREMAAEKQEAADQTAALKESEERVLHEVLTEFLG